MRASCKPTWGARHPRDLAGSGLLGKVTLAQVCRAQGPGLARESGLRGTHEEAWASQFLPTRYPPLDARRCHLPGERADRPCTCSKAPTCTGLGVWGPTGLGCWHISTQRPRVTPATLRPSEPHGALTAPFLPPGVKASPEPGRKRAGRGHHTLLPAGARPMHASSFLPHVAAEGTVDSWGSRGPHFPHTDVSTALCTAPALGDHSINLSMHNPLLWCFCLTSPY